ncbi:MAG TPA: HTTM domain-containing protein [Gryllotalpicola sp.]
MIERLRSVVADSYDRAEGWLLDEKRATYGASVSRIVYGVVMVAFVLANASTAQYHWGGASGWADPMRETNTWGFPFTVFSHTEPNVVFLLLYALLGVAGLSLMVGFYSRLSAMVCLYLYISLVSGNPLNVDQTDNAIRIILFFFCFTDLSRHWSVDAWRRSRPSWRPWTQRFPALGKLSWVPILLHNFAIVAIAVQLFIIYTVAGLSKVKGVAWQNGTAVYYPLNVARFEPWPAINHLLGANALLVMIATYVAVFVQLFFPFLMLAKWTRRLALLGIFALHAGIALFMGLPLFSLSMLAADTIFISTPTYLWLEAVIQRMLARIRRSDPAAEQRRPWPEDAAAASRAAGKG